MRVMSMKEVEGDERRKKEGNWIFHNLKVYIS